MKKKSIILEQHPDALYDCEYETLELNFSHYRPIQGKVQFPKSDKNGLTITTDQKGLLRIDACTEGILRFRALPKGEKLELSTTEKLALINREWDGEPFSVNHDTEKIEFTTDDFRFVLNRESKDFMISAKRGLLPYPTGRKA